MWHNLSINANNIQATTDRSVLIKVPKTDYKFWHPLKLVRQYGKNGYMISIGYTDDFIFRLFKNGKGRYNKNEKIEEIELTADEFVSRFFETEEGE